MDRRWVEWTAIVIVIGVGGLLKVLANKDNNRRVTELHLSYLLT